MFIKICFYFKDFNELENTENMLCDDDSLSYEAINTTNASSTSMDNFTKP